MSEPAHFFIEIARPGGYGPALWGVTEEGWYTVEGTSLRLTDAADMPRLNYEGKPRSATLGRRTIRGRSRRNCFAHRSDRSEQTGLVGNIRYRRSGLLSP
jgi:hypothetical protein